MGSEAVGASAPAVRHNLLASDCVVALDDPTIGITTASEHCAACNPPRDAASHCPNCGDDCWHEGYPWCRPCGEHHRSPECAVDEQGRSLMSCGCAWSVVEAAGHGAAAHYAASCYIVADRDGLPAQAQAR